MFNLIDLVQLDLNKKSQKIPRGLIEQILSSAVEVTKESVQKGNDVYWVGLCKFTWKQKAKTKKQAAHWQEFPYEAEGNTLRCVPIPELDELDAKGLIFKMEKANGEKK